MKAFEVSVNGKRVCVAGIGEWGVMSTILSWVSSSNDKCLFHVGGLDQAKQRLHWIDSDLSLGDEVTIRFVDAAEVDPPTTSELDLGRVLRGVGSDEAVSKGTKPMPESDGVERIRWLVERRNALSHLARSAFAAREFERAVTYASELLDLAVTTQLPQFLHDGHDFHLANILLGRTALRTGDLEGARRHLIEAGRAKPEATLVSFGPDMTLAKELLEQGERKVVLEYFDLCKSFWRMCRDRLDEWSLIVKDGAMPDFGPNLHYFS